MIDVCRCMVLRDRVEWRKALPEEYRAHLPSEKKRILMLIEAWVFSRRTQ